MTVHVPVLPEVLSVLTEICLTHPLLDDPAYLACALAVLDGYVQIPYRSAVFKLSPFVEQDSCLLLETFVLSSVVSLLPFIRYLVQQ